MGARFNTVFSVTNLGTVPASGAETVICTTPQLVLPFDNAAVFIWFSSSITVGAGTTQVNCIIRRGTTVSAPLAASTGTQTVTAGNVVFFTGSLVDANPGPSAPQYSLSMNGTGTTGAFVTNSQVLIAAAL